MKKILLFLVFCLLLTTSNVFALPKEKIAEYKGWKMLMVLGDTSIPSLMECIIIDTTTIGGKDYAILKTPYFSRKWEKRYNRFFLVKCKHILDMKEIKKLTYEEQYEDETYAH